MNVLFVTLWPLQSNTSAALRNHALISGLQQIGCMIDVVCIEGEQQNPFFDADMEVNRGDGQIRSHILQYHTSYRKLMRTQAGLIGKLKQKLIPIARKWYHRLQLFDYTQQIAKRVKLADLPRHEYDLVISSSDPKTSHLAVQHWLRQGLITKRWIQYWGDPLALDITNKHLLPAWYVRRVERTILGDADRIIYVSPFTQKAQSILYPEYKDRMTWLPIPYAKAKCYEHRKTQFLRIGYFGDYKSSVRNLLPLIEACKRNPQQFQLEIAGNTDLALESTEQITIYPRISAVEVEQLEANCDVLICLLNLKGTQIPGKVYHYAATNKPILILLDGEYQAEMAVYFEQFDRFICCANDANAIASALLEVHRANRAYVPCESFAAQRVASAFIQE